LRVLSDVEGERGTREGRGEREERETGGGVKRRKNEEGVGDCAEG
jgi:hypothetical protein